MVRFVLILQITFHRKIKKVDYEVCYHLIFKFGLANIVEIQWLAILVF